MKDIAGRNTMTIIVFGISMLFDQTIIVQNFEWQQFWEEAVEHNGAMHKRLRCMTRSLASHVMRLQLDRTHVYPHGCSHFHRREITCLCALKNCFPAIGRSRATMSIWGNRRWVTEWKLIGGSHTVQQWRVVLRTDQQSFLSRCANIVRRTTNVRFFPHLACTCCNISCKQSHTEKFNL